MIQADTANQWGFVLYDNNDYHPGGFGVSGNHTTWEMIEQNDSDFQALPEEIKDWFSWELDNDDDDENN